MDGSGFTGSIVQCGMCEYIYAGNKSESHFARCRDLIDLEIVVNKQKKKEDSDSPSFCGQFYFLRNKHDKMEMMRYIPEIWMMRRSR